MRGAAPGPRRCYRPRSCTFQATSRLVPTGFGSSRVATAAACGLRLVYSRTLFGLVTAGVAENSEVAAQFGWSAQVVQLSNFALAGALSAGAATFLAPIVGLRPMFLTLLVIPALAAALVGRFESFGLTVGAAATIGLAQAELSRFLPEISAGIGVDVASLSGLPSAVPMLMIVVAAGLAGSSRQQRGEASVPLPRPGLGVASPRVVACAVALSGVAVTMLPIGWVDAAIVSLTAAILVLSVMVVTGYAGQLLPIAARVGRLRCVGRGVVVRPRGFAFRARAPGRGRRCDSRRVACCASGAPGTWRELGGRHPRSRSDVRGASVQQRFADWWHRRHERL